MNQRNGTPTERNDWVSKAIPSARKGLRGLNKIAAIIPGVNLINPGTYKDLYSMARKGAGHNNLHYGAFRFESQGYRQLTAHNQPKIFRSILRNEALHNDPEVRNVVERMSRLSDVNGYKFEIKCTENENHGTSVSCPVNQPDTMIIRIGKNSPQATKAALLMAHEVAYAHLPPSQLNLDNWVQSDERTDALKNAIQGVAIENAGNGSYNISHRVQAIEPARHSSSSQTSRFAPGAVPPNHARTTEPNQRT